MPGILGGRDEQLAGFSGTRAAPPAVGGMGIERRESAIDTSPGCASATKLRRAGDGDIGMADASPNNRRPARAGRFPGNRQHRGNLTAAIGPGLGDFLVQALRRTGSPPCQPSPVASVATFSARRRIGSVCREHRLVGRHQTVEIIDDMAVDQRLAAPAPASAPVSAGYRPDLPGVAEGRPGLMGEANLVQRQRNADAADEGQNHTGRLESSTGTWRVSQSHAFDSRGWAADGRRRIAGGVSATFFFCRLPSMVSIWSDQHVLALV